MIGLLQQVNNKLRLANVFGRSWSAREARESPTPLEPEGDSLQPLGGITPHANQLPLADGSLGESPLTIVRLTMYILHTFHLLQI